LVITDVSANNGLEGTIPTEFGNLLSSEAVWLSESEKKFAIP